MDHAHVTGVAEAAPKPRAFAVHIPRALHPIVEALPTEVRQRVLAELFRVASLTTRERSGSLKGCTYALRMEVAGCTVSVEMDDARSRLMLTGLTRPRPQSPGSDVYL